MSLPPGFIDELRGRVSLSDVVGRRVVWDARKSNAGRGDMWAPCPFHHEKTPSFHVDDRKGFYYCFGCHEKGDLFAFVQKTENVDFMEAVRLLAGEAGMALPDRDPAAAKRQDARDRLGDVMEQAVRWFRLQLRTGAAEPARDYLAGRGLDTAAQGRWEIGFAPAQGGVLAHLRAQGVAEADVIGAGLAAPSDRGGAPYDRFRGRIVFPIRDARGRAIGLGGRAMDPNARAKYYNSPETPLFDKGRSLYNHGPARAAAGDAPLIVAEGYMDVIALVEAGFAACVAPLGTAITEDQLQLMWRMHPEPIVALDGDAAGQRAALRLVDLALPLLAPGQSLRFCILPPGQDPDDVIRAGGSAAMQALLDGAEPMIAALWRRETEGRDLDSPERRAAFDTSLADTVARIADPGVRRHYDRALKDLRWKLFDPRRKAGPSRMRTSTRAHPLVQGGGRVGDELREATVLAVLLAHPGLAPRFEQMIERIEFQSSDHAVIAAALLRSCQSAAPQDPASAIAAERLERLRAWTHLALIPALRPGAGADAAALCLEEELTKLLAGRGVAREMEEAMQDIAAPARDGDGTDEGLTWRLAEAVRRRDSATATADDDRARYDTGANGTRLDRSERTAFADLLRRIGVDSEGTGRPRDDT